MKKIFHNIAIVGLGLIGGSLAQAIKHKRLSDIVTGFGRSPDRLRKAQEYGIIDRYFSSFEKGLEEVDLVVISTPPASIVPLAEKIIPHLKQGTVITDVGSVKGKIVQSVESFVSKGVYFIGGHPIAGTENSGFESSFPTLFKDRICILTPTHNSHEVALEKIKQLWTDVGSRTVCMDVQMHDKIFAAISHLPHMVAFSLVAAIVEMKTFEENILQYSAGGFKDFTRIAASDPVMWRDIALMNRENVLKTLKFFKNSLSKLEAAIKREDSKAIEKFLKKSRDTRRAI